MRIELIPKENISITLPLLSALNPSISQDEIRNRLAEMIETGYECVGVFDEETLVGICGIWTLTKIYVGRHIEPDNVIISPEYRSRQLGQQLMEWVESYARSKGCVASELNCYVSNEAGNKFWQQQDYKVLGLHYQKKL
ncbi:MAG TPA: GNAT family N-acetyltransferase [Chitinophagaceae bacterium]|jgi:GNAT superfamily N-acetyltransferase|nr:GNAT family N-acetyltransferase [Chitinophagaceae bacterium]